MAFNFLGGRSAVPQQYKQPMPSGQGAAQYGQAAQSMRPMGGGQDAMPYASPRQGLGGQQSAAPPMNPYARATPQQPAGLAGYMGQQQARPQQQSAAPRPQAQQMGALMGGFGGLLSDENEKEDKLNWRDYASGNDPEKKSGGGLGGMLSGMLGGLAKSDRHSKEQITRLEGANEALGRALSSRAEYPSTQAPSTGLQALGQQAALPSQASFPDSAQRVAAQNQALSSGSPFAVNMQRPDLEELDAAYARLGQGG